MNDIFSLPTDRDSIINIEKIIQKTIGEEVHEDLYAKVLIALTEALNNAIIHGNKNDRNKKIYIKFQKANSYYEFHVSDEGEGFDYSNLPNPIDPENIYKINGRGIFIMKNLSDDIRFEDCGKTVILKFQKDPCFSI